jgi:hypothetical protein
MRTALLPLVRSVRLVPLLQREWLQHRFVWLLMMLVPLGLGLLLAVVGHFEFDDGPAGHPDKLPLLLAMVPPLAGGAGLLLIALLAGLVTVSVLARRDHGDRSIEFWLSLPVPHTAAFGVPMLVHLVIVPAVALLIGALGGQLIGALLVGRIAGWEAIGEVPWGLVAAGAATMTLRLLAGLPLAVLWALPIILLLTLMYAWFRRWGWVILIAATALQGLLDQLSFGQRWLLDTTSDLLRHAGKSFVGAGGTPLGFNLGGGDKELQALHAMPLLATRDFGAALAALASPLFVGAMLFSAGCFVLLLRWRRKGAGAAD